MESDVALDEHIPDRSHSGARVLFVAWRNPETRSITPVGRLTVGHHDQDPAFEFRYLARARDVLAQPFTSFPDFDSRYRSTRLFPFFENRMVPVERADFGDWAASIGLPNDSDPFEVLASNGGMRATDTLEIFPEPLVDPATRTATLRFLVRGVRHREGANDEIDRLQPGDRLQLRPETTNEVDPLAVLVIPETGQAVGWVPAYLCPALHRSAAEHSWSAMTTVVCHVGERLGPSHFRLLCEVVFPWPFRDHPFDTPEFEVA